MTNDVGYKVSPSDYFETEFFAKELDNILEKYWIFICPEKTIANHNDYFVFSAFEREIVFMRTSANAVVAFNNVCKHRGHKLYSDTYGNSEIRCPYHGWLYGDDLNLKKIPWNNKCFHLQEDKVSLDAFPHVMVKDGVVWGYFGSKQIADVEYAAEKVSQNLVDFSAVSVSPSAVTVNRRKFNWKLIFENLYDRVHPIFLHANSLNKTTKINFDDHGADFSFDGVTDYVRANIDNIGEPLVKQDANSPTSGSYINGHVFPFLHFLTPNGGGLFCYESYVPVAHNEVIVYTFWVSSNNMPLAARHNMIIEYVKGASKVLEEDWVAVESVTAVVNKPEYYTYGAHEKNYYGLKKLGESNE